MGDAGSPEPASSTGEIEPEPAPHDARILDTRGPILLHGRATARIHYFLPSFWLFHFVGERPETVDVPRETP